MIVENEIQHYVNSMKLNLISILLFKLIKSMSQRSNNAENWVGKWSVWCDTNGNGYQKAQTNCAYVKKRDCIKNALKYSSTETEASRISNRRERIPVEKLMGIMKFDSHAVASVSFRKMINCMKCLWTCNAFLEYLGFLVIWIIWISFNLFFFFRNYILR